MKAKLALVAVFVSVTCAQSPGMGYASPRTAVGVEPVLRDDVHEEVTYLEIEPILVEIPAGQVLDWARLTLHGEVQAGDEVELWLGTSDALPWDSSAEGQRRLRTWVVDARTGSEIRFDISSVVNMWLTSGLEDPPSMLLRLRDLAGETSRSIGMKEGFSPEVEVAWRPGAQRVRP